MNFTIDGLVSESVADSLTAHAGGTQASAFQLAAELNNIGTVTTSGDSVALPASKAGLTIVVINVGANPAQVFGVGSDTINGVAAATGVSQMQNSVVLYVCTAVGKWFSEGLATGFSGSFQTQSAANAVSAHAGGGQSTATALTAMINRVTTVTSLGDSVVLPAAAVGLVLIVSNAGANPMDIFPNGTDVINSLAASTAIRINNGTTVAFYCAVAGQWHMLPAPPAYAKFTQNTASGATTASAGDLTGAAFVTAWYTAVSTNNLTTRTAAQMFSDAGNVQPGDSYMLQIINTAAGTTTLVGSTGVTTTSTMTIAPNAFRLFNVKFNTATTLTIQSVGTGTYS